MSAFPDGAAAITRSSKKKRHAGASTGNVGSDTLIGPFAALSTGASSTANDNISKSAPELKTKPKPKTKRKPSLKLETKPKQEPSPRLEAKPPKTADSKKLARLVHLAFEVEEEVDFVVKKLDRLVYLTSDSPSIKEKMRKLIDTANSACGRAILEELEYCEDPAGTDFYHDFSSLILGTFRSEIIQILMDLNVDPDYSQEERLWGTPLMYKVSSGFCDLGYMAAVVTGKEVDEEDDADFCYKCNMHGPTALWHACTKTEDHSLSVQEVLETVKAAETLLDAGADINRVDAFGCNYLHECCKLERLPSKMFCLLLDRKCDTRHIDDNGLTPLMAACQLANIEAVRRLLPMASQEELLWTDRCDGCNCALLAVQGGSLEILESVIQAGSCWNIISKYRGFGALHYAAMVGSKDVVKYLCKELGADPDSQDELGDTALTTAVCNGKVSLARVLVEECGASVDIRNKEGKTPRGMVSQLEEKTAREMSEVLAVGEGGE